MKVTILSVLWPNGSKLSVCLFQGDWEPAKNVAGTAALREWKKIKKEII
jgi:hypothetical protein